MSSDITLRMQRVQQFTNTERTTLRVWFDLDAAGKDVDADRLLNAGLLLEHLQSTVDDDPRQRTGAELSKLDELQQNFLNELDLAKEVLADNPRAVQRIENLRAAVTEGIVRFDTYTS